MPVILLDHNYTLVSNSESKKRPFSRQIEQEEYRSWLVALIRTYPVVLITARPEKYRGETLARIKEQLRFEPDLACFNEHDLPPPQSKRRALDEHVFPRFGAPLSAPKSGESAPEVTRGYVAIESNPKTRAMYASLGIPSLTVARDQP